MNRPSDARIFEVCRGSYPSSASAGGQRPARHTIAQAAYASPAKNAAKKHDSSAIVRVKPGCRCRKRLTKGTITISVDSLFVYFCAMRSHALLDDLTWRGLLYQSTDE